MIDLFSYPEMVLLSNVTEVKIKNCICKLTNNYLLCYSLIKLILIRKKDMKTLPLKLDICLKLDWAWVFAKKPQSVANLIIVHIKGH